MADIIDDANERSDIFLRSALSFQRKVAPAPTGVCFFCGDILPYTHRWCDVDCRDDWEREKWMEAQRVVYED